MNSIAEMLNVVRELKASGEIIVIHDNCQQEAIYPSQDPRNYAVASEEEIDQFRADSERYGDFATPTTVRAV